MGKNPEHRFAFIQSRAAAVDEGAIDALAGSYVARAPAIAA
jgi:hypothetical protein